MIGKSNQTRNLVPAQSHNNNIQSNIPPDVILPKRRNESDITLAKCHTISSTPKNKEITISKNLTSKNNGTSTNLLLFPLS